LAEWPKAQDFRGARVSFADNFLQKQQKQRRRVAQLSIFARLINAFQHKMQPRR